MTPLRDLRAALLDSVVTRHLAMLQQHSCMDLRTTILNFGHRLVEAPLDELRTKKKISLISESCKYSPLHFYQLYYQIFNLVSRVSTLLFSFVKALLPVHFRSFRG